MKPSQSIRFRHEGPGAEGKYGLGRKLLGALHDQMRLGGLQQLVMRRWIDGTYFEVSNVFGQDEIRIFSTGGDDRYIKENIERRIGQVSYPHVVWGSIFPESYLGYFPIGSGPVYNMFPTIRDGFVRGFKDANAVTSIDVFPNRTVTQPRFSLVSPVQGIRYNGIQKGYAHDLSLDELSDYNQFGEEPFGLIDAEPWSAYSPRYALTRLRGANQFIHDTYMDIFTEQGREQGIIFTNGVSRGAFLYDLLRSYFREEGSPYNAVNDDESGYAFGRRYLVMDTFYGAFNQDAFLEFYGDTEHSVNNDQNGDPFYPKFFQEIFGLANYDFLVDAKDLKSWWYITQSFNGFIDVNKRVTQAIPLIEDEFKYARTYDTENVTTGEASSIVGIHEDEVAKMLYKIGFDLALQIESDAIEVSAAEIGVTAFDIIHESIIYKQ